MTGKIEKLNASLTEKLLLLEKAIGFELVVTSGRREPAKNLKAGGVKNSAHLPDENDEAVGVDVVCLESGKRFAIVFQALALGFVRIGVGETFVHLDLAVHLPQRMLWHYYPKKEKIK